MEFMVWHCDWAILDTIIKSSKKIKSKPTKVRLQDDEFAVNRSQLVLLKS